MSKDYLKVSHVQQYGTHMLLRNAVELNLVKEIQIFQFPFFLFSCFPAFFMSSFFPRFLVYFSPCLVCCNFSFAPPSPFVDRNLTSGLRSTGVKLNRPEDAVLYVRS
jgi:hypothetical protein